MNETLKSYAVKGLVVLVIFGAGAAVGRFAGPSKIEIKDTTTDQSKTVTSSDDVKGKTLDKNVVVTKTETDKPDGTKVITTVTQDKSTLVSTDNKNTDSTATDNKTETKDTTKTYSKNDWMISALVDKSLTNLPAAPGFGVSVQRRIIGPFYLGAFGLSDGNVGASVGVSF